MFDFTTLFYGYYVHDHLYSPAVLVKWDGTVLERYEYDAYGNCSILEPNFAPDPDGKTDYGNPYLFTGRRLDILDNGSLKIQYNRNRYYDYYTGRWMSHDQSGYVDGLNLYEYVKSNSIVNSDPLGLSLKTEAINALKELDNIHSGYDYYTKLTGLESLIVDKLIPALEWLDEDDYSIGGPRYEKKYFFWRHMYLPQGATGSTVFHEAIHAYLDKKYYIDLSARTDEGIAHVATNMEMCAGLFKYIEDRLKEDVLPTRRLESSWRTSWRAINIIVPTVSIRYQAWSWWDPALEYVWKWTQATETDVSNVAKHLDFKLSCGKIAEHYNKILKAHPNWRKARCPRFICTTVPIVNVKSLHLDVELHSVFK